MKIVFLGTPEIACPFLSKLISSGYIPIAVITQPDKKAGRGLNLICPPVKKEAEKYSINVFQPLNNLELKKIINELKPDLCVVVAYGLILKKEVLDIPCYGFLNVHFSLLPKYRGADPVRRAILNGETQTGVTIFKIDEGMDTGPILLQEKIEIGKDENSSSIFNRLIPLACDLLLNAIEKISTGKAQYITQKGEPSYAHKLSVNETFINFSQKNTDVYNKIRAFSYDPYARSIFQNNDKEILVQIISASLEKPKNSVDSPIGGMEDFEKSKGIFIKCLEGSILIKEIKPAGKKVLNAYDYFVNGYKIKPGERIFKV